VREPERRVRLALILLATLVIAAPASAATRFEIVSDCADDSHLQGEYTVAELRDARRNLQAEAEYTDCADVLRRAELALTERSGSRGVPSGPGPAAAPAPHAPANEAERAALREARESPPVPVTVRGHRIEPGSAGFSTGSVRNEMPGSLLPVVIGLALLLAWALATGFVRRGTGEAMGNDLWRPIP
jgi:hypothetical protein